MLKVSISPRSLSSVSLLVFPHGDVANSNSTSPGSCISAGVMILWQSRETRAEWGIGQDFENFDFEFGEVEGWGLGSRRNRAGRVVPSTSAPKAKVVVVVVVVVVVGVVAVVASATVA